MYLTALLGMIFCLLWGGVGTINAQTKTVAGTVSDDKGELIVGGTIRVKDTQTATITDIDGNILSVLPLAEHWCSRIWATTARRFLSLRLRTANSTW